VYKSSSKAKILTNSCTTKIVKKKTDNQIEVKKTKVGKGQCIFVEVFIKKGIMLNKLTL